MIDVPYRGQTFTAPTISLDSVEFGTMIDYLEKPRLENPTEWRYASRDGRVLAPNGQIDRYLEIKSYSNVWISVSKKCYFNAFVAMEIGIDTDFWFYRQHANLQDYHFMGRALFSKLEKFSLFGHSHRYTGRRIPENDLLPHLEG